MTLHLGDCLEVMRGMEPDSIDAIVTDPPYGLAFMGKDWDHGVPGIPFWEMALRVAKPGAHLLAFGGTRTSHRLAVAIEDAGWEIRDTIMWVYGSGFPKSLDVSKAIDKAAGAEREVVGEYTYPDGKPRNTAKHSTKRNGKYSDIKTDGSPNDRSITAPATDEAQEWAGWGTALKPAWEPIIVARKPLRGTVAANVLAWGTGGINVDGCRVVIKDEERGIIDHRSGKGEAPQNVFVGGRIGKRAAGQVFTSHAAGRWPANLVHDGSDEVVGLFPVTNSRWGGENRTSVPGAVYGNGQGLPAHNGNYAADTGSAARFFYCAKASRADRDEGLDGFPVVTADPYGQHRGRRMDGNDTRIDGKPPAVGRNNHPTVKPTDLMRWLVRLVTRPGGVVLDPFMGSGSTGKAAALEGLGFVGIEQDGEYLEIARRRMEAVRLPLFAKVEAT